MTELVKITVPANLVVPCRKCGAVLGRYGWINWEEYERHGEFSTWSLVQHKRCPTLGQNGPRAHA